MTGGEGIIKVHTSMLDQRPGVHRMDNEHVSMCRFPATCLTSFVQAALMCMEQQEEVYAARREARAASLEVNKSHTARLAM
jgi:hypothetical protein